MVCCKAKEFDGWCNALTTCFTDPISREEYCLFHAPYDDKWASVDAFNAEVHGLIKAAIASETECNLSGTVFPGDIDFRDGAKHDSQGGFFLPPINFTRAAFFGFADFTNITFSGWAYFNGANFFGGVGFGGATFLESAYFKGVTSNEQTYFYRSTFSKQVHFRDNTTFSGEVNFAGATFSGEVNFENVNFLGNAYFCNATFSSHASFGETLFNGSTLFTMVKVSDEEIFFKEIDLAGGSVSFLDTNLANFRFERCRWPQKKVNRLRAWVTTQLGWLFTTEDTDVFRDEKKADEDFSAVTWRNKLWNNDLSKKYGMVEDLYRQMKQQAKERHNEPEASKWHYREKEMYRKKKVARRYFPLSFTNLYWAFSGYGERPVRAGGMLLALFLGIAMVMNWLGLESGDKVIQEFSFSPDLVTIGQVIQTIIEHALFIKEPAFKAQTIPGAIVLLMWTRVLIPVQATLFVFALRNKFRR